MVEVQPGIRLAYETFGAPDDPPLLLVMGLGSQMLLWHDDFCTGLVDRGFRVIRFDNRDIGGSTRFDHVATPSKRSLLSAHLLGRRLDRAPYDLSDMARDTAGLLDALDIDSAHVVGASMGGMIAQTLAIEHPERVRSLTSIMSTTGERTVGRPSAAAIGALLRRPEPTREGAIEHMVRTFQVIGSPVLPAPEDQLRDLAARCYDRGPAGTSFFRQLGAVLSSESRSDRLSEVRVPSLVMHGALDPLISPDGGLATAEALPHAELLVYERMAHDLPRLLWPSMLDAIGFTARRADLLG